MPTIMTHAVVGLGLGRLFTARRMPRVWFWEMLAILAILPDIDVLAFRFSIPYEAMFGHRGFTHSIPFAFGISAVGAGISYRLCRVRFWDLWGLFFVVTASHGILDACTYGGGHGIAFFAPFTDDRWWLPFRPIQVSQMGLHFFTDSWTWMTLWTEFIWVWLPTALVVGVAEVWRNRRDPPEPASESKGDESAP